MSYNPENSRATCPNTRCGRIGYKGLVGVTCFSRELIAGWKRNVSKYSIVWFCLSLAWWLMWERGGQARLLESNDLIIRIEKVGLRTAIF